MGVDSPGAMEAGNRLGNSADRWKRDWQWLARRAPLIDEAPLPRSITEEWKKPLSVLAPVEAFFSPDTTPRTAHRVGYYTEALVHAALLGVPGVTDLRHGLPVREEARTLGELDFLFRHEGRLCHLEVALKFYLYSAGATCLGSRYIGPNAGDTLERKAAKLLGHQLPLGRRAFPEVDASYLFCPGILFHHPGEENPAATPEFLSPGHDRGVWLRSSEFGDWLVRGNRYGRGEILRKPFWLSALPSLPIEEVASEVDRHFTTSRHPLALALSESEDTADPMRVFVVADDWPEKP